MIGQMFKEGLDVYVPAQIERSQVVTGLPHWRELSPDDRLSGTFYCATPLCGPLSLRVTHSTADNYSCRALLSVNFSAPKCMSHGFEYVFQQICRVR